MAAGNGLGPGTGGGRTRYQPPDLQTIREKSGNREADRTGHGSPDQKNRLTFFTGGQVKPAHHRITPGAAACVFRSIRSRIGPNHDRFECQIAIDSDAILQQRLREMARNNIIQPNQVSEVVIYPLPE